MESSEQCSETNNHREPREGVSQSSDNRGSPSSSNRKRRRHRSRSRSSDRDDLRAQLKQLQEQLKHLPSQPSSAAVGTSEDPSIPEYDPEKDRLLVENWVKEVDRLAQQSHWNDKKILRLVAGSLKGEARAWYVQQLQHYFTWKEMKGQILSKFRRTIPFAMLLYEAATYRTAPGQELGDYVLQKMAKLRALNVDMPDECVLDAVIDGIANEEIVRMVRDERHTDLGTLYEHLKSLRTVPAPTDEAGPSWTRAQGWWHPALAVMTGQRESHESASVKTANDVRCSGFSQLSHRTEDCKRQGLKQDKFLLANIPYVGAEKTEKNDVDRRYDAGWMEARNMQASMARAQSEGQGSGIYQTLSSSTTCSRRRSEHIPIVKVRMDPIGHWPLHDNKQSATRCRNKNCTGSSRIMCSKCKVHLCITKMRNCFLMFHS